MRGFTIRPPLITALAMGALSTGFGAQIRSKEASPEGMVELLPYAARTRSPSVKAPKKRRTYKRAMKAKAYFNKHRRPI